MVGSIVLLVPSARAENLFKVTVKLMVDTIMLDRRWQGGKYTEPPVDGLRTAGMLYFPWIVTDAYLNGLDQEKLAKEFEDSAASFARWDAWAIIRRYQASSDHDVSRPFGGDMARALGHIRASVLLLPGSSDRRPSSRRRGRARDRPSGAAGGLRGGPNHPGASLMEAGGRLGRDSFRYRTDCRVPGPSEILG